MQYLSQVLSHYGLLSYICQVNGPLCRCLKSLDFIATVCHQTSSSVHQLVLGSSWIRSQDERLPDPTKPFPAAPIAFFFQVAGTCRDQGHANRANRARVTVPVASSHSSRSINHTDTIRCLLSRFCWSMTLE